MKYLIDRAGLIRSVWQGGAAIANDHTVPDINPFWVRTPQHTYDVARAKALLAEAGYPNGLSLELWTSNERVGMQEVGVAFQQMAAPAGVKIDLKTVPLSVFVSNVYKKKPLYINNWYGRATIDETLYPYFHTGGGWNEGNFSNTTVDKLLEDGRSASDIGKRKEAYAQAQRLISNEAQLGVGCFTQYVSAMRSSVKGYVVHPLKLCDFRTAYLVG